MRLKDKIVLVTSAQNPCAAAIVMGFAREGANCVLVDDDASKAEKLAGEVRSLGRSALSLRFDITNKSQVEEVVRRTVAEFGRIDVLLNCSGLTYEGEFLHFTEEAFNACVDRGPKAYFLACVEAKGRHPGRKSRGLAIRKRPLQHAVERKLKTFLGRPSDRYPDLQPMPVSRIANPHPQWDVQPTFRLWDSGIPEAIIFSIERRSFMRLSQAMRRGSEGSASGPPCLDAE